MPINLPNLDDRQFKDLIEETRALIPTYAPAWTNHNPSDPGVTLVELFAYLAEMLIYRLNRITDDNMRSFLKLLNGPTWEPSGLSPKALSEDVRQTVLALRKRERAVTCEDFETLAREADEQRVARAHCVAGRDLSRDLEAEREGHISLIIVPREENESQMADILQAVDEHLDQRRLLTTFVHVVGPFYVPIRIKTTIRPKPDERLPGESGTVIQDRVVQALQDFLRPLPDPERSNRKGWPFGRNVFVSEIYDLLDRLEGVDYVDPVDLWTVDTGRLIRNDENELVGISVKPHELVQVQITTADVTVQTV